ncbi:peptidase M23 [Deinococcus koreensis]|uniref:Peptidase M23 n=2 Tax=Deinococcus koreensis TaxID=2054903 RepID=A0A2K3V1V5_9DEIO|nr:peptidase M23 [Deinococcus koreensis]
MSWGLCAALVLSASGSARSPAPAPSAPAPAALAGLSVLAPLQEPSRLLAPAPDLVLRRDAGERALTLVVAPQIRAAELARRYGVSAGAVRLLPPQGRTRLARVAYPRTGAQAVMARAPLRPASVQTYAVQPGDTLAGIARRFGLPVVDLLSVNLDRPSLDRVHVGETLNVPVGARGVLIRIKPGQSALSLIAGYGADLVATAQANGVLPTEMSVGDELLLPGLRAEGYQQQLMARREAQRRAALAGERQKKYERFVLWKKGQERLRLEALYQRQAQYERYLAWQRSEERQARIRAYERQAQLEAAQAAAAERAREAARAAASRPAATVQRASTGQGALIWPMRSYRLTSRFGEQDIAFHQQVFHGGIDLAAPYGSPVYAAAAGQVSRSGYGDYGLNVFTVSGATTLVYGHMSRVAVYAGQTVAQGQLIGYVGCSGICTGPHLHFEVRAGQQAINPLAVLP